MTTSFEPVTTISNLAEGAVTEFLEVMNKEELIEFHNNGGNTDIELSPRLRMSLQRDILDLTSNELGNVLSNNYKVYDELSEMKYPVSNYAHKVADKEKFLSINRADLTEEEKEMHYLIIRNFGKKDIEYAIENAHDLSGNVWSNEATPKDIATACEFLKHFDKEILMCAFRNHDIDLLITSQTKLFSKVW